MKITLTKYGLFLHLIFSFFATVAQQKKMVYPNADRLKFGSDLTYIFKVPEDSVLDYCYKGKSPQPNSAWLQQPLFIVSSNKRDSLLNHLQTAAGHYLLANVNEGNLSFTTINTSTFTCNLVNIEQERLLIVRDKSGNTINDARVKIKGKTIPFDKQLMAFVLKPGQGDTVEVRSGDGLQYFIARNYKNYSGNNYEDRYYNNQTYYYSPEFKGYLVTNQPTYKPGDTLRYKAHLLNKAGKPATDTFDVQLHNAYAYEKMRIHKITPQAPGVYFGEFVLGDTVIPDRPYILEFAHAKKGIAISQQFKVEDYLLEDIYLKVKDENLKQYQQGDSVVLYAFAHNANGLPLTDGELELWVLHNSFTHRPGVPQVFVPDTLYHTKIAANPESDTRIAFPSSIFPEVKNLGFTLKLRLKNAQFEQRDTVFTLYYIPQENYLKIEEQGNKVVVQLIKNKKSISGKGYFYHNQDSTLVSYPLEIERKSAERYYRFTEIDDSGKVLSSGDINLKELELSVEEQYKEDTATFRLNNPRQTPVRYAIFKGNDLLTKGTVAQDTLIKVHTGHDETVTFQYAYERNGYFTKANAIAFKLKSHINIKLKQKDIVFPGQKDTLELSVSDAEKKAISGLNMTVLAFNANFKEDFVPKLNSAGLIEPGLKADTVTLQLTPFQLSQHNISINQAWAKNLSLDTAYFYKNIFLSKAPYTSYVYETKRADMTQLAVYIRQGNTYIFPEYIMYDNTVPLYVKKATITTNPNAIPASNGKRNLIVRTGRQLFRLYNVDLEQGKKTILFINPDTLAHKQKNISSVEKMPDTLMQWEKEGIMRYTLQINNERSTAYTVRQFNYDYKFNPSGYYSGYNNYYDNEDNIYGYGHNGYSYHAISPVTLNSQISYFQEGNLKISFMAEPDYLYAIRPGMFRMEKMREDAYLRGPITDYRAAYNFGEELSLQNWDSLIVNPGPKKEARQRSRSVFLKMKILTRIPA